MTNNFHEQTLELGKYRNKVNACYTPSCDGISKIAIKGIGSGRTNFYCEICANNLLTRFYNLFTIASK